MSESLRISFLTSGLGQRTSGQSRFLFNLCMGLSQRGHEVRVLAYSTEGDVVADLANVGVRVESLGGGIQSRSFNLRRMTPLGGLGVKLGVLAHHSSRPDWYVTLSDDILDAITVLPPERTALISNGSMALLYLNPTFYAEERLVRRLLSVSLAEMILKESKYAARFRLRLGNSRFTSGLMGYLYSLPFHGNVYPPVNRSVFHPSPSQADGSYMVTLARNASEQNLDLISSIAGSVRVIVAGGASVARTESRGVVTDAELSRLYAGASALLFPSVAEPFGYAVAEAMSCGTPTIAFDSAGPAEQITHAQTGWLAKGSLEFAELARSVAQSGVPDGMRERVLQRSVSFSVEESATAFERALLSSPAGPD